MDRPTVARWREIASLLVAGSLLASTLAPAVIVSAAPLPPTTGGLPAAQPSPDAILAVAFPGPASTLMASSGSRSTGRKPADPWHAEATERPSSTCVAAPSTVKPAKVVRHGPRDQKVVALTFDDGWDPANTLQILGTLERFHVNATFFPVGRAVQEFPAVWQEVARAGFPIGDHSYDHPHLKGMCFAGQLAELTKPQRVMLGVLGARPFAVMRPPYGSYDLATQLAANAAGDARVILWDVDTRDWSGISRWAIVRRALAGQEGSIILMHTFVHATAAALPRIIAVYRARGYRFVTIGQLLGLGGPVPYP